MGDVMLVFGGNSHNGTIHMPSDLPCFSMDFLAYDTGTVSSAKTNLDMIGRIERKCSNEVQILLVASTLYMDMSM